MKTRLDTAEDTQAFTRLQNKMDESEVLILGTDGFFRIEKKDDLELFLTQNRQVIQWQAFFYKLAARGFIDAGPANEKYKQRTAELIRHGALLESTGETATANLPDFYYRLYISKLNARKELLKCFHEFEDLFV